MSPGTNASKKTPTTKKSTTACRKPKAKNYSSLDDQLLCTAYVNISSNGAKGTGQTAEMFWNDVHKVFLSLHPPEKVASVAQERDAASLMNRFQRHIQKSVNIFNKYYRRLQREGPSGTPDAELVKLAIQQYNENEKPKFQFEGCLEILKELAKFQTMVEEQKDALDGSSAVNIVCPPMGHGLPRPTGSKAAKKMLKEDRSIAATESEKVKAIKDLAGSHEILATELQRNRELTELKNKQDHCFKMFELYRSMGKVEEAERYMIQLEQLSQPPSGGASRPPVNDLSSDDSDNECESFNDVPSSIDDDIDNHASESADE